jgi:parallel beta-helix repeat protein
MLYVFLLLLIILSSKVFDYQPNITDSHEKIKIPNISPKFSYSFLSNNETWLDYGIDTNENGLYNQLIINLGKPINLYQDIDIYAILKSTSGAWLGYTDLDIEKYSIDDILLSFNGEPINLSGIDGPYEVWISMHSETVEFSHEYTTSSNYDHKSFENAKAKINGFSDTGLDSDGDSLIDKILCTLSISVFNAGEISTGVHLLFEDPLSEEIKLAKLVGSWDGHLTVGDHDVVFYISTSYFYTQKLDGPYSVSFAYLSYENLNQQFLHNAFNTSSYLYSDFDPPSVYLTGNYWDRGEDTNGDGKYNQMIINLETNFTDVNYYSFRLDLTSSIDSSFEDSGYTTEVFSKGVQNVTITIDATLFYSRRINTSYDLRTLRVSDIHHNDVFTGYQLYTTRVYNYTEFDIPKVFFTGNYWDRGEDTDQDGKFDVVIIDVEVNVSQEGEYSLYIRGYENITNNHFSGSHSYHGQWSTGISVISVSLNIETHYSQRLNTSYIIDYIRVSGGYWMWYETLDRVYDPYITRVYHYNEFDPPPIFFTGKFRDQGEDEDYDGKFDYILVQAEVNVTEGGFYEYESKGVVNLTNHYFIIEDGGYFVEGIQILTFGFEVDSLYSRRLNTSYIIEYISIYDAERVYFPHTTRIYNFNEFDIPGAYILGHYCDYGIDTNADGKIDQIVVSTQINVTYSTNYEISIVLRSENTGTSHIDSLIGPFLEGIQYVNLSIDASSFFSKRVNTSYEVEYVNIRGYRITGKERVYPEYETRRYNYTEFDSPLVFCTLNFFDKGEDTDSDGEFNGLVIDVEVNVTQAGEYRLDLRLDSLTTSSPFVFLNKGIINLSLTIDGSSFFSQRENNTYRVNRVRIRDEAYNLLDQLNPHYLTRIYNYTEFERPTAYLTMVFSDRGNDTDQNGLFDSLLIDMEVNITQAGNYYFDLLLEIVTVKKDYWNFVNGTFPIGVHNISITFDLLSLYYRRLNSTFIVTYVRVYDENHSLIDRINNPGYFTRFYYYNEFDLPGAIFTNIFNDTEVDNNSNGKFDALVFSIEVNVTEEAVYYIELEITSKFDGDQYFGDTTKHLETGIQTILISFETSAFYWSKINTSFIISLITIRTTETYNILDQIGNAYETRIFNFTEFDEIDHPIFIYSNADFFAVAESENWSGNGSKSNPFIITDLFLGGTAFILIEIVNTDVFFEIRNCTMKNSYIGVKLRGVRYGVISNNTIVNSDYGIDIIDSDHITIVENQIQNISTWGLSIHSSDKCKLETNNISNCAAGVVIWDSYQPEVVNNQISDCHSEGIGLHSSLKGIFSKNHVFNNAAGIILYEESDSNRINENMIFNNDNEGIAFHPGNSYNRVVGNNLENNSFGISITDSYGITVTYNSIKENMRDGIRVESSNRVSIAENQIINNKGYYGVNMFLCGDSTISANEIGGNDFGIILDDSWSNNVNYNTIQGNNRFGIWLDGKSEYNRIINNDFIGNNFAGSSQALDDGLNNTFRNNYWDDWIIPDFNRDGVVDNPYPIDGNADNTDPTPRSTREPFTMAYVSTTRINAWEDNTGVFGVILLFIILSLLFYNNRKLSAK